jgi:hypothetical protein
MATKPAVKSLFKGKDDAREEKSEARALKSGKITKSDYVKGEKSEGDGKGAANRASAIKSGKLTPAAYAKMESKKK